MTAPEAHGDVGVLLVHGIGDHQEGQTLATVGESLVDWLREWLRSGGRAGVRGDVVVTQARLRATRTEAESPAYAMARVDMAAADGVARSETWLFCEAWWGGSVQPPASLPLLRWMWSRGPLLIYWHFYLVAGAAPAGLPRAISGLACSVFAFLLAAACQLTVALAMLLWVIPIGPWRRAVIAAVRALTLTLGDSYVVLEQAVQRAALVERVRRSLGWLAERVDRTIVIAHSQGAAIAHEALRQGAREVATFVTVGSGLEKLQFLRRVRDTREGLLPAALIVPLVASGGAALAYAASDTGERWHLGVGVGLLLGAFWMIIGLTVALERIQRALTAALEGLRLPGARGRRSWIDLYASHDVVPMGRGSLFRSAKFVTRSEIESARSFATDHVTYFQDHFGCLLRLWRILARHSRLPLLPPADRGRLRRFARVHATYARLLSATRVTTVVAAVITAIAIRGALVTFGASALTSMAGSRVGEWLAPLSAIAAATAWLLHRLWRPDAIDASTLAHGVFGFTVLFGAIAGWWAAFNGLWRSQCVRRWRRACLGRDVRNVGASRRLHEARCAAFVTLGSVPLLVSLALATAPEVVTIATLGRFVSALLAALLLALAVFLTGYGPWAIRLLWREDTNTGDRFMAPLMMPFASTAFVAMGLAFWPFGRNADVEAVVYTVNLVVVSGMWQAVAITERGLFGRVWVAVILLVPPIGAVAWAAAQASPAGRAMPLGIAYAALTSVLTVGALAWCTATRRLPGVLASSVGGRS